MAEDSTKKIHLKIITHEKIVYENDVNAIFSPGIQGEFGILYNHTPFMTILKIGVTRVVVDNESEFISTLGGIFQLKNNNAIILADEAEKGTDIDIPRAKLAKERAEARLGNAKDKKERARAERAIARAMARLKAAKVN
ncbi:F0F1 ATP synthase subunit epsilon [bacterium]|nr:F0F1 ATP synthase subunit epsilon [bacterium]